MGKFFNELKRRNVVRVGLAYIVVGWLVFQIGEVLFPVFGTPPWVFKTIILVIAIGLPFALIFAWAFELTPEGVRKTRDVDIDASVAATTGRKLDFVIIGALLVALGYFVWDRQAIDNQATVEKAASEAAAAPADNVIATKKRSIAVIPFVNMSSDQDQEWFADGLTEEILNSLARTPDLLVSARTSSFIFKGSKDDIPTIAKALGVEHILEGSVRRSGERLRVTAQLIRASDGFHLWSETYDRTVDDMIDIQENVAIEIANALETAMDPDALALMVSSGTSSVPAYEAYLLGLSINASALATGDKYESLRAKDAFERAIELDPEFSGAYWRLALFWYEQSTTPGINAGITGLTPSEILQVFRETLDNAIKYEKDPVSKIQYQILVERIELNFRRELRLNTEYLASRPNDQRAQTVQITLLAMLGRQDEVAGNIATFLPNSATDPIFMLNALHVLRGHRHYGALRAMAKDAVIRFRDNAHVLYQAHRAFLWVGDIDSAAKLLPIIEASDLPDGTRYLASLRQACAENRLDDAKQLRAQGDEQFSSETGFVWLGYLITGDKQQAEDLLKPLDDQQNLLRLTEFLTYASFDAKPYPNLMALLKRQGIERGEVMEIPYQCQSST